MMLLENIEYYEIKRAFYYAFYVVNNFKYSVDI